MLIFRVEHKTAPNLFMGHKAINSGAYGATVTLQGRRYSCVGAALNGTGDSTSQYHQPMPHSDAALLQDISLKCLDDCKWMFCFASVAQYHAWFNLVKLRESCSAIGRLAVYNVPTEGVAIGTSQCVADAAQVTLVNVLPLDYEGAYND